ncbi:MAG: SCO family protein [Myxococcota bacterium]
MIAWMLAACYGGQVYIVKGVVVEVHAPDEVVLDHEDIPGLMGAMVMPFEVADPSLLSGLSPGDRVTARYVVKQEGSALVELRVTGHGPSPVTNTGPAPIRPGEVFPATELAGIDGSTLTLGPAQTERIALTFVYTRCPRPEFCPAMITRLQALQRELGAAEGARIVAVTLDPAFDTSEVLSAYARAAGAGPGWTFARVEPEPLAELALRAGLPVLQQPEEIAHGLRLLVIDRGGRLLERYDDARFPLDRVVEQLTTGAPAAADGNSGTLTPDR